MLNTEQNEPRKLETITCSRCGGCGRHSYCERYGSTCFKCGGAGKVYTKRGAAALAFFNSLLSKNAGELVVGDVVRETAVTMGAQLCNTWYTVEEIKPDTSRVKVNGVEVDTSDLLYISGRSKKFGTCGFCGISKDKVYRVAATVEQKKEALAKALDYQDTLTKAGTVRKAKGGK